MIASQLGQLDTRIVRKGKGKKFFTILMAVISAIGLTRLWKLMNAPQTLTPDVVKEVATHSQELKELGVEVPTPTDLTEVEVRRREQSKTISSKGIDI